ncbi:hypothetical protein [Histidinibacterium aquaticum]|uniref:Sel1 repeat family protein n=1 Tax=Histidinibacterium aquaticum TaxID=2613962 RepID=A0A5J5GN13_9RHOB|nr:hypothetical protein [Histidinibacterium aquaticum]KAA9009437.1 hypothetical protein F3S47_09350 [Histidinibacterium aquaticum]
MWKAVLVIGLAAFGAGAALVAVPSRQGYAELLLLDDDIEAAILSARSEPAEGPPTHRRNFLDYQLAAAMGDITGAATALEALPASALVDSHRIAFAHATGAPETWLDLQLRQDVVTHSAYQRQEVASLLRRAGRYEDERAYLARLAEAGSLDADLALRLAWLELAAGETRAALVRLADLDDAGQLTDRQGRVTLASLLIEAGQGTQADARVARWDAGSPERAMRATVENFFASEIADGRNIWK